MKPQTPRTKNRFFFIGPSHGEFYGGSFLLSGQKDLPTGISLFIDPTAVVTEFSLYGRQKKSSQISLKMVPIAWTTSRVDQIWSQIKKLIF